MSDNKKLKADKISRMKKDKLNELEFTNKKIEELEEQLANLYNIKRKNSILLKKSIEKHEKAPWINWKSRSPKKEHKSVLKNNTDKRTKNLKAKIFDKYK